MPTKDEAAYEMLRKNELHYAERLLGASVRDIHALIKERLSYLLTLSDETDEFDQTRLSVSLALGHLNEAKEILQTEGRTIARKLDE